jgi:hypothetical protein
VPGGFVGQLDARGQAELVVDVAQMRLDRSRGDEESCGNVFVGQAFSDEADDIKLGGGERSPTAGRPLAFTPAAQRVGDRFVSRNGDIAGDIAFRRRSSHRNLWLE